MTRFISLKTVNSILTNHTQCVLIRDAMQKTMDQESVGTDEKFILNGVKDLDEDSILLGLFNQMGIPSDQVQTTLTVYKSAFDGKISSQEITGNTFFKFGNYTSAKFWWEKASESGSKHSKFQLGVLYLTGKGCQKNLDKAEQIFSSLIDEKNKNFSSRIYHNLALVSMYRKEDQKMEYFFRKAADLGNSKSNINLSDIYRRKGDMVQAEKMCRKAHELGDPNATFLLSGFAKTKEQSMRLVIKASENGCWKATVYLAYRILLGKSIIRDFRHVTEILRRVYPSIPIYHEIKSQVINLIFYLETFGDGAPPDVYDSFINPCQMDSILKGELDFIPVIRTLEEDACWERDNLNMKKARELFIRASETDGLHSPRVHFNLGFIYYHGLGMDVGKINQEKSLYHLSMYVNLVDPRNAQTEVLSMIKGLIRSMSEDPEQIQAVRKMGFVV